MTGTLEFFQTHQRRALRNTPEHLSGWLERVNGLTDEPPRECEVLDLDDYRGPKSGPLLRTPHNIGGYPPVSERSVRQQAEIARGLGAHGGYRTPFKDLGALLPGRKRTSGMSGSTVLAFPFRPLAVLRNPRKLLAYAPTKEQLLSSVSMLPEVSYH